MLVEGDVVTIFSSPCLSQDDLLEILLARIRLKEEQALSRLYDLLSKRVFGIAKAILSDPDSAGEATMDVFTKVWNQANQYDPEQGSARAWLNTLSRNCALDHLRRHRRRAKIEDEGGRQETNRAAATSPETQMFRHEQAAHLRNAMKALNEDQIQVLSAAYFEGMSHNQIARSLDKPLGTVKTQIRQALDILRRRLSRDKGEIL